MTNYQHALFPYAYNILGSADDALDVIQDVMVKQHLGGERYLENERAYLIKSVVNQAINLKNKNKRIREQGVWLPEPVSTDRADGPLKTKEIISYSLLVLLEYLNGTERAVFILKEAFDYSHEEIAETLSITVENSRKILSRARGHLRVNRAAYKSTFSGSSDFLETYVQYIKNGDTKALEGLLWEDIAVKADGGTQMKVVREFTKGIQPVMDLMLYLYQHYQHEYRIQQHVVNHQPALLFYHQEQLVNCQVFEWDESQSKIHQVFSIVDPEKLCRLGKLDIHVKK